MNTCTPNIFIPGAQKSGTSSIANYLNSHPSCVLANPKEPGVFSRDREYLIDDTYSKYFTCSYNVTESRFLIDASTSYMTDKNAPLRIRQTLDSEPYFIFILRNPVYRTISAYWHLYKRGHEKRLLKDIFNFSSNDKGLVLQNESNEIEKSINQNLIHHTTYVGKYDDPYWPFRYIRNSCYTNDLLRYYELFSKDKILILTFDDLINDPFSTYDIILSFLNIKNFYPSDLGSIYNSTLIPKSSTLINTMKILNRATGISGILTKTGTTHLIEKILYKKKPTTPFWVKNKLYNLFQKEIDDVSKILNRPSLNFEWSL